MTRFQWEEYLSFLPLFPRVLRANLRPLDATRVRFGQNPQQYVLCCEPPAGVARRSTGIVFIHGGGWRMGSPAEFRFAGAFLAGLGFPTLLAGYRLAPAVKFPAQLEDVYAGCQAGMEALKEKGLLPRRWVLGGQSAGAQLAALLAWADPARRDALLGRPAGMFLVSGPLDFSFCVDGDAARLINDYVEGEQNREAADPIRHVRDDEDIPVLCIHGDRDPTVDPQNSLSFAQKVGSNARVHMAAGWHHSDLVEIFLRPELPASKMLVEWLDAL